MNSIILEILVDFGVRIQSFYVDSFFNYIRLICPQKFVEILQSFLPWLPQLREPTAGAAPLGRGRRMQGRSRPSAKTTPSSLYMRSSPQSGLMRRSYLG